MILKMIICKRKLLYSTNAYALSDQLITQNIHHLLYLFMKVLLFLHICIIFKIIDPSKKTLVVSMS